MALPGVAAGSSVSRDDHERNVRGGGTSRTSMQSRMSSQNDVYRSLRSSMSSSDEEAQHRVMSMSKRWTTLETVGRCMFLFSVAFFIVGVLITVFGFSNTGIDKSQQVPLQVSKHVVTHHNFITAKCMHENNREVTSLHLNIDSYI